MPVKEGPHSWLSNLMLGPITAKAAPKTLTQWMSTPIHSISHRLPSIKTVVVYGVFFALSVASAVMVVKLVQLGLRAVRDKPRYQLKKTTTEISKMVTRVKALAYIPPSPGNDNPHAGLASMRTHAHRMCMLAFTILGYTTFRDVGGNLTRNRTASLDHGPLSDPTHVCLPRTVMNRQRREYQGDSHPFFKVEEHVCQDCPEKGSLLPVLLSFVDFYLTPVEIADQIGSVGVVVTHDFPIGHHIIHDGESFMYVNHNQVKMITRGGSSYVHNYNMWQQEGFLLQSDGHPVTYRSIYVNKEFSTRVLFLKKVDQLNYWPRFELSILDYLVGERPFVAENLLLKQAAGRSFHCETDEGDLFGMFAGEMWETSRHLLVPKSLIDYVFRKATSYMVDTFRHGAAIKISEAACSDFDPASLLKMAQAYAQYLVDDYAASRVTFPTADSRPYTFGLINPTNFVWGLDPGLVPVEGEAKQVSTTLPKALDTDTPDLRHEASFPKGGALAGTSAGRSPSSGAVQLPGERTAIHSDQSSVAESYSSCDSAGTSTVPTPPLVQRVQPHLSTPSRRSGKSAATRNKRVGQAIPSPQGRRIVGGVLQPIRETAC